MITEIVPYHHVLWGIDDKLAAAFLTCMISFKISIRIRIIDVVCSHWLITVASSYFRAAILHIVFDGIWHHVFVSAQLMATDIRH